MNKWTIYIEEGKGGRGAVGGGRSKKSLATSYRLPRLGLIKRMANMCKCASHNTAEFSYLYGHSIKILLEFRGVMEGISPNSAKCAQHVYKHTNTWYSLWVTSGSPTPPTCMCRLAGFVIASFRIHLEHNLSRVLRDLKRKLHLS